MLRLIRLIAVAAIVTTAVIPVLAKDGTIGTTAVVLPPPTGYCELDASQPSDARMLQVVEDMLATGTNRLLAISANCKELVDWRNGRRKLMDNLAQYQTLKAWEDGLPAPPATVVAEVCKAMRARGEQFTANAEQGAKARAEEVIKEVKINEMKFMGVVGEEPNACYTAMLQRFQTEMGTDKTQVTVFSTTIVRSKLVYFYLFAPYVSGDSVTDLLAQQKAQVRRLHAANR